MIDVKAALDRHLAVVAKLEALEPTIRSMAQRIAEALKEGGKVLWMGNGGSAADSQHLAAELVGRYTRERPAAASIALTTDSSILTAIGNDYGFESIFARQIEALCSPGDVVVGISTSGNSPNVLAGIEKAQAIGAYTMGFTGGDGGRLAQLADVSLVAPSKEVSRIQECHILIGHIICDWVEASLVDGQN